MSWQSQFKHWIVVTQEWIDFWESKNPEVITAKEILRKNGINFEKLLLERWKAQIKAWQSDLDEFSTLDELREKDE